MDSASQVLRILDKCCADSKFPAFDNGYVYLAAARLSLFRSAEDWAMVFEIFGFNPRAGAPTLDVTTFASRLHERDTPDKYVSAKAHDNYLATNPHNDSRFTERMPTYIGLSRTLPVFSHAGTRTN